MMQMNTEIGIRMMNTLGRRRAKQRITVALAAVVVGATSIGLSTAAANTLVGMAAPVAQQSQIASAAVAPNGERVKALLNGMSLEDKVGQMMQPDTRSITPEQAAQYHIGSILSGGGAAPSTGNTAQDWAQRADAYQKAIIEDYGVPLLYGVDAVHGNNNVLDATIFPHNVNLGQTGDADLVREIGAITAQEVRATGANWAFTPTLGIPKNERWGRSYETYGENAELVSKLGSAYIEGSQRGAKGTGSLSDQGSVMATAKHFIGEGITANGKNQGDVPLDYNSAEFQRILHSELLVPYRSAVQDAVASVMVSYNSIGGVKCHGNAALLTGVLKNELGFTGIVVTDYNGVDQIEGSLSYAQKVAASVNAGVDMLMVDGSQGTQPKWVAAREAIIDGVNNGDIPIERVNDAATRILNAKESMGLLQHPESAYSNQALLAQFGSQDHRAVARKAVAESLTLLKNSTTQQGASTLMADLPSMKNIVVAGSSADDIGMQSGGWTISWQGSPGNITAGTTIYQGLQRAAAEQGNTVDLAKDGIFQSDDYEAAIVVAGETPYAEYAGDREANQLTLQQEDANTIATIRQQHPNLPIVLVLTSGRALTITPQLAQVDALVMAGLPGSEGEGVADILLSSKDFQGHLTTTWPKDSQDIPVKFTDASKVLFPYGYGLSKTSRSE